jgi:hypothetical protein
MNALLASFLTVRPQMNCFLPSIRLDQTATVPKSINGCAIDEIVCRSTRVSPSTSSGTQLNHTQALFSDGLGSGFRAQKNHPWFCGQAYCYYLPFPPLMTHMNICWIDSSRFKATPPGKFFTRANQTLDLFCAFLALRLAPFISIPLSSR